MPLISIIVPVYNAKDRLFRCVDSIVNQTHGDFELLLINDGSTDGSEQLCEKLASYDSRIKVIHKNNGGASSARNTGLDYAKGELICFIDSDDWVDKEYIDKLLPGLYEDMVICSLIREGDGTKDYIRLSNNVRDRRSIVDNMYNLLEHMAICSPCCKIFKREILESHKIRFDTKVWSGEDMLFVFEYLATGLNTLNTISEPLYHYDVADGGSLSHKIVPFETTLYVMDRIHACMLKLAYVYDCDMDKTYKRLLCTQFNNLVSAAKAEASIGKRIKYFYEIFHNKHICLLLKDYDYIIERGNIKGMKVFGVKLGLRLLNLCCKVV